MSQTGLIVRVPEAESQVQGLRDRFHAVAKLGVPAHVTVLFPFMAPELIGEAVHQRVYEAISGVPAFEFTLANVGRFPATTYLVPEPAAPFVLLTKLLAKEFPEFPPFGGEFETIIPHLTVAHGSGSGAEAAQVELTAIMKACGPIKSICKSVDLLENSSGTWKEMYSFPLYGCSAVK